MVRFARNQRQILVVDGFLGAMIGALSVGSMSASSALAPFRVGTFLVASSVTTVLFAIPMFVATVALAPALLAVLRRWNDRPPSSFYLRSALAGIAFGVVVCPVVGFVFGLLIPLLPQPGGIALTERLVMLVGAPLYLAIGFFFVGFVFWKQVLIAGLGFGLLNGWWVRRQLMAAATYARQGSIGAPPSNGT